VKVRFGNLVIETLKGGIDGTADNSAWPDRAVKPRSGAPQALPQRLGSLAVISKWPGP
jgi:hypothetical protein